MRAGIAAAALLALLAPLASACGPLPKPFQPETKANTPLEAVPDSAGVAVAAVTGAVPDGPAMAEAMAEALRKQNVPASVAVGNRASRWLLGDAERRPAPAGQVRRRFVWELYGPDGDPIGTAERTLELPAADWRASDPELLERAAAEAAGELAAMIQGPSVQETDLPGYPAGTRVVLAPLAGEAPPAFERALTSAMTRRLRARGLPLADQAQAGDVVIDGRVDLGPAHDGQRALELVWTLTRDGRDGPLGDLRQANPVPVAQLQQQPERLADLIARAALPGVIQVLESGRP
jgi:hypothetical protein